MDTKLHYFDWLNGKPKQARASNTVMAMRRMIIPEVWFDYYPIQQKVASHYLSTSTAPFVVDIGGSTGKDLARFHSRFTYMPGRLVLEDQPEVVDSISALDLDAAIERVKDDFFTAQPAGVKGAKIFYLGIMLHDWPDKGARVILGHVCQGGHERGLHSTHQ